MPVLTEAEQRAAVVAEARRWIGTPYHHKARVLGAGVDCAQILIAVFSTVGEIEAIAPDYPPDWHLHRSEERYVGFIEQFATEYDWRTDPPRPGDVVVWRYGRTFSHGAIVTEWPSFVHAFAMSMVVVEDPLTGSHMATREMRAFSRWPRAEEPR